MMASQALGTVDAVILVLGGVIAIWATAWSYWSRQRARAARQSIDRSRILVLSVQDDLVLRGLMEHTGKSGGTLISQAIYLLNRAHNAKRIGNSLAIVDSTNETIVKVDLDQESPAPPRPKHDRGGAE